MHAIASRRAPGPRRCGVAGAAPRPPILPRPSEPSARDGYDGIDAAPLAGPPTRSGPPTGTTRFAPPQSSASQRSSTQAGQRPGVKRSADTPTAGPTACAQRGSCGHGPQGVITSRGEVVVRCRGCCCHRDGRSRNPGRSTASHLHPWPVPQPARQWPLVTLIRWRSPRPSWVLQRSVASLSWVTRRIASGMGSPRTSRPSMAGPQCGAGSHRTVATFPRVDEGADA